MHAQIPLLTTLVTAFLVAFALGFIANLLRISPIVGYLAAGVVIGPFTPGFHADPAIASQLAEIGVILLMFGVGLQFSLQELLAVRWIAVTGALVQTIAVMAVGSLLAAAWGWSYSAGVVLGLALSVASTIVMLRVVEELRALRTPHGRIAVGWLLFEDLMMVLLIVLLPALAVAGDASQPAAIRLERLGETLLLTLGKVAVLAALMLVVGRRVIPWFLGRVAGRGSRELFTLAVLAAAFGIAFVSAEVFAVSFALGAFLAGIVLAESDLSHQAAANSLPFRDAFAVLFFVSIGMLFDPAILIRDPLRVGAIVLTIVLVRPVIAALVVAAFRYPARTLLFVGASRAQIGEFSFILAGMGTTLGLLPPDGPMLIVGGALLSIAINPLVFRALPVVERQMQGSPALVRFMQRLNRAPGDAEADGEVHGMDGHAIVAGYGRVGSLIGEAFRRTGVPFVVVDDDRRLVDRMRNGDTTIVYGNAASPGLLEAAGVRRARLIVAAVPDGFVAGQILLHARQANPDIETVARAHDDLEVAYLNRLGVNHVRMGERELALGLAEHAMLHMGAPGDDVRLAIDSLKTEDSGPG